MSRHLWAPVDHWSWAWVRGLDKRRGHGLERTRGICHRPTMVAPWSHHPDPSTDGVFGPLTSRCERGTG